MGFFVSKDYSSKSTVLSTIHIPNFNVSISTFFEVGSIDELVDVLSNAQLLENQSIEGKAQPSMATRGYVEVCNGDNKCQEELGEKFPKFGFIAHEFDTVAGTC